MAREKAKKWYEENKERAIAKTLEIYYNNREEILMERKLKKYNLTIEKIEKMKIISGNVCEICKGRSNKMCIDHCHKTGVVRGLLCHKCNFGIGFMKDDPEIVASASSYLNKHNTDDNLNVLTSLFCRF